MKFNVTVKWIAVAEYSITAENREEAIKKAKEICDIDDWGHSEINDIDIIEE
jgi:hypothetical protein